MMATIKLADGRGELYQWDTGRKVVVDDETIKQVHYQNRFYGRTIDVDVSNGAAIIPDQLLQSFAPLVVFAWAGSAEDGYTKIEKTFEVHKRNKPAGYVFTPVDQKTLDDLQRQIGDLDDLATEAKENLVAAINEAVESGGAGSMDLRVADGYIQYSTDGGRTWENLIAVADLNGADGAKGDKGDTGAPGEQGPQGEPGVKGADGITPTIGENGDWYIGDTDTGKPSRGEKGEKGEPGSDGAPGSPGAPGAAGQNGHSPVVTATKSGKTTTISVDGTAIATVADGADGAPGKDGSPGAKGDKGDTGPQGPKGDPGAAGAPGKDGAKGDPGTPGKDGAGMDITGATIGQVAKIKAVDASGVPTAWEPVDMPSGGSSDAVLYTKQVLTDEQKKQARENIEAETFYIRLSGNETLTADKTFDEIITAYNSGLDIFIIFGPAIEQVRLPLFSVNQKEKILIFSSTGVNGTSLAITCTSDKWNVVKYSSLSIDDVQGSITADSTILAYPPSVAAVMEYVDDGKTVVDDGNGNLTMDGATAQTALRYLQSLTVPGLNFKYVNPMHGGTISDPYGLHIGSGVSLVDTINTLTEPGLYTVYQNRASTDVPDGAKAINSSLRGLACLSQIKKHYAFILMVDQASNFYVQYIQNDVGGGWKQMPDPGTGGAKECILQSTTPNSTKKFKITVDDSGALSAVEVTE